VREALFAMLGPVEGASVLDLFAGTGALGIEALSRGAERAVFVERDARVARVLNDNLAALGLGSQLAEVRCADALGALRSARGRKETYDLLFIDPPYRQANVGDPAVTAEARGAHRRRERPGCTARARGTGRAAKTLRPHFDHNPPPSMTRPEKSIAVCPGSYDPITNGHLDVIRRTANLYDEVVVAVVNRSVRKSGALFGIEERVGFIERAIVDLDTVRVEPFSTLVVDFARSVGAKAIVKGLRAISDFEYELEMNQLNRRQDPEIESVYLMASPQYSFLSSSGVKELATFGGRIDDLVPDEVARRLQEELTR
jgi:pantetheine-phosphate adenylyltransferase